ncbi:MAG: mannose-6-phosphate isomerase, class I [Chitinophagaceae bacterium]|nr:mannose-6-phosphate isomerase, class I [Chitinophagaceae bacterium]
MQGVFLLKGTVKHYDWGGQSFIPDLLNMPNPGNQPFAEYWMGTHHLGMSQVLNEAGETVPLSAKTAPLPYLFKVLDVKDMLSIQVHPSKNEAEIEFARENAEDIPLDSPLRNYKDDNHKPELMVALSDFWLLHGFKPEEEIIEVLYNISELKELLPVFNQSGYVGLYRHIMVMPQQEVNRILKPLLDNIPGIYDEDGPTRYKEDFWALRAAEIFNKGNDIDRGIFSIYLFNLVFLKKGDAIFQDAGVPHAYLEGQNIEIMANSDNVLRGGLTAKNIDVKELLKHTKCEATYPQVFTGDVVNPNEKLFKVPVPDFRLSRLIADKSETVSVKTDGAEILFLAEGEVLAKDGNTGIYLKKGEAVFCLPGTLIELETIANAVIFRAGSSVHISE